MAAAVLAFMRAVPVWVYGLLVLAGGWAYTSHQLHDTRLDLAKANRVIAGNATALAMQKQTAAALLRTETERVAALQAKLDAAKAEQETKDANNQITVDNLSSKLAAAGRLRDPYAKPARCGGGSGSTAGSATLGADGGATNTAEGAGVLSVELGDFLRRLTREADQINNAYASCRSQLLANSTVPP